MALVNLKQLICYKILGLMIVCIYKMHINIKNRKNRKPEKIENENILIMRKTLRIW